MKTSTTTSQKNTSKVTLFVLFVFMFLSTSTVFGQETKASLIATETSIEFSSADAVATSSVEFAIWFVGSANTSSSKSSTLSFGKKQLINNGITTNKVLIKKVLKTIVGQENNIA